MQIILTLTVHVKCSSHWELGWFVLLPVTKTISLNWDTVPLLLSPLFCPFSGPDVKILILSAVTNSCGSGFKREYVEECPVCPLTPN